MEQVTFCSRRQDQSWRCIITWYSHLNRVSDASSLSQCITQLSPGFTHREWSNRRDTVFVFSSSQVSVDVPIDWISDLDLVTNCDVDFRLKGYFNFRNGLHLCTGCRYLCVGAGAVSLHFDLTAFWVDVFIHQHSARVSVRPDLDRLSSERSRRQLHS